MYKTSEWVSLGHPDKVADFISCYLLDRYLERDPKTRFAVEVQITRNEIGDFVRVAERHPFRSFIHWWSPPAVSGSEC